MLQYELRFLLCMLSFLWHFRTLSEWICCVFIQLVYPMPWNSNSDQTRSWMNKHCDLEASAKNGKLIRRNFRLHEHTSHRRWIVQLIYYHHEIFAAYFVKSMLTMKILALMENTELKDILEQLCRFKLHTLKQQTSPDFCNNVNNNLFEIATHFYLIAHILR